MAQLSDDAFAFGGELMSVDEALALMAARVRPVAGVETVALDDADGRVVGQDLRAPISLPPFDNSAVDGYAVRRSDLDPAGPTTLPVEGRIAAGDPASGCSAAGRAVRIFTGAPVPADADMVFMQEDVSREGERVVLPPGLPRWANMRRAGEDVAAGSVVLPAGRRLRPQDVALAAAVGLDRVPVRRRLRVAVFSTGDELRAPGEALAPGQIFDANRALLRALLVRAGARVSDLGILRDEPASLARALAAAAADHDLLVTSGGVSTGEEDHVRAAVASAGSLVFWRLAIKPGRPVALGVIAGVPLVGLPGNPVAAFVTGAHVLRPLIAHLGGERLEPATPFAVRSGFAYRKKTGRREYVRVSLVRGPDGALVAEKHRQDGAGVISSLTETAGLVELSESMASVEPGDVVPFLPFAMLW